MRAMITRQTPKPALALQPCETASLISDALRWCQHNLIPGQDSTQCEIRKQALLIKKADLCLLLLHLKASIGTLADSFHYCMEEEGNDSYGALTGD
ncbi:hypothetical protein ACLB2K_046434 [Fragaria x ananassa]